MSKNPSGDDVVEATTLKQEVCNTEKEKNTTENECEGACKKKQICTKNESDSEKNDINQLTTKSPENQNHSPPKEKKDLDVSVTVMKKRVASPSSNSLPRTSDQGKNELTQKEQQEGVRITLNKKNTSAVLTTTTCDVVNPPIITAIVHKSDMLLTIKATKVVKSSSIVVGKDNKNPEQSIDGKLTITSPLTDNKNCVSRKRDLDECVATEEEITIDISSKKFSSDNFASVALKNKKMKYTSPHNDATTTDINDKSVVIPKSSYNPDLLVAKDGKLNTLNSVTKDDDFVKNAAASPCDKENKTTSMIQPENQTEATIEGVAAEVLVTEEATMLNQQKQQENPPAACSKKKQKTAFPSKIISTSTNFSEKKESNNRAPTRAVEKTSALKDEHAQDETPLDAIPILLTNIVSENITSPQATITSNDELESISTENLTAKEDKAKKKEYSTHSSVIEGSTAVLGVATSMLPNAINLKKEMRETGGAKDGGTATMAPADLRKGVDNAMDYGSMSTNPTTPETTFSLDSSSSLVLKTENSPSIAGVTTVDDEMDDKKEKPISNSKNIIKSSKVQKDRTASKVNKDNKRTIISASSLPKPADKHSPPSAAAKSANGSLSFKQQPKSASSNAAAAINIPLTSTNSSSCHGTNDGRQIRQTVYQSPAEDYINLVGNIMYPWRSRGSVFGYGTNATTTAMSNSHNQHHIQHHQQQRPHYPPNGNGGHYIHPTTINAHSNEHSSSTTSHGTAPMVMPLERPTTLGLLLSPFRRPIIVEKWTPFEISKFEAALSLYGKQFHIVQRAVGTKTTKELIEFYYVWKKTSHYLVWKHQHEADMEREIE